MYEHLLVALDGSPAAEGVLDHAQALASAFSSTITLLRHHDLAASLVRTCFDGRIPSGSGPLRGAG